MFSGFSDPGHLFMATTTIAYVPHSPVCEAKARPNFTAPLPSCPRVTSVLLLPELLLSYF